MKSFSDYLAWIGGADLSVLKRVPPQRQIFIQMGLTMLTTASTAVLSMFFALHYSVHGNLVVSIIISIFWGVVILNLNRLILVSLGRTRNRKFWLLTSIPWLLLAVLQSFATSVPLVLRIFSSDIQAQLNVTHKTNEGILGQLQALSDLGTGNATLKVAYYTVGLLFFLIEILPFLVKLLLNIGPMTLYDRIVEENERLMTEAHNLAFATATQGAPSKLTEYPSRDQVAFTQELAHSLNTPLSQIEAAALLLLDDPQKDTVKASGSQRSVKRIHHSVEICKAFLAAFMQITNVASQTSKWNPESLEASIQAAAELYADKARSGVKPSIHMGTEPRGYSASYIMAVTLPIIENAFESAKSHSTVSIEITARPREYRIRVTSAYEALPSVGSMYVNGFTTKAGHQGIGLSVVQRLLSAYQGAHLAHEITNGQISFVISLPGGKE